MENGVFLFFLLCSPFSTMATAFQEESKTKVNLFYLHLHIFAVSGSSRQEKEVKKKAKLPWSVTKGFLLG